MKVESLILKHNVTFLIAKAFHYHMIGDCVLLFGRVLWAFFMTHCCES